MSENNADIHTGAAYFGAEHFNKVASTYETSSPMSKTVRDLISLMPPISSTSIVLDNASGPGIVTQKIIQQSISASTAPTIFAADISPAMIELLKQKNFPTVKADVMDAQELSYHDNTFTHVFMNMAIFLLPEPEKGAREIYRTLKPGGVAIVTSGKQAGWVRIFQAAQKKVHSEVQLWQGPLDEEWSRDSKLRCVLIAGGFKVENISITTTEFSQLSSTLGNFLNNMKDSSTKMITKDWSDIEKQQFEVGLQEEFKKTVSNPEELEVVAWVAVARK